MSSRYRIPSSRTVTRFEGKLYLQDQVWTREGEAIIQTFKFTFCAQPAGCKAQTKGRVWTFLGLFDIDTILDATQARHRYKGWLTDLRAMLEREICSILGNDYSEIYGLQKTIRLATAKSRLNLANRYTKGLNIGHTK